MDEEKTGILLVDDDPAVRGLTRIILEHEGWRVEEAVSLEDASGKVRTGGFRPHVAIVDVLLPDGLGTEVENDLREARHKSKVVYITGDPAWLRRLSGTAELVLAKPFTPGQLVAAVRSALNAIRPVAVVVEAGRVYQRLIASALEQESVEAVTANSFEEGLELARRKDAAVLFTPQPDAAGSALERLMDLRRAMPRLAVVALGTDGDFPAAGWYDRRLVPPFSAHSVGDALRYVLSLRTQSEAAPSQSAATCRDVRGRGHGE